MSRKPKNPVEKRQRVELQFLEALRRRCPAHEPILEALGHLYTRVGRYEDGLRIDLELTRLRPREPENWYNLACSYALIGDSEKALAALEQGIDLGYDDGEWMRTDPDLAALRQDPRFLAMVKRLAAHVRWNAHP
jgi:tetratricopeptide (TPR) repeat protein